MSDQIERRPSSSDRALRFDSAQEIPERTTDLLKMIRHAAVKYLGTGDVLMEAGQPWADLIYFVAAGRFRTVEHGYLEKLIGPKHMIGETDYYLQRRSTVTAVATEPSRVLVLDGVLLTTLHSDPNFSALIVIRELKEKDKIAQVAALRTKRLEEAEHQLVEAGDKIEELESKLVDALAARDSADSARKDGEAKVSSYLHERDVAVESNTKLTKLASGRQKRIRELEGQLKAGQDELDAVRADYAATLRELREHTQALEVEQQAKAAAEERARIANERVRVQRKKHAEEEEARTATLATKFIDEARISRRDRALADAAKYIEQLRTERDELLKKSGHEPRLSGKHVISPELLDQEARQEARVEWERYQSEIPMSLDSTAPDIAVPAPPATGFAAETTDEAEPALTLDIDSTTFAPTDPLSNVPKLHRDRRDEPTETIDLDNDPDIKVT